MKAQKIVLFDLSKPINPLFYLERIMGNGVDCIMKDISVNDYVEKFRVVVIPALLNAMAKGNSVELSSYDNKHQRTTVYEGKINEVCYSHVHITASRITCGQGIMVAETEEDVLFFEKHSFLYQIVIY